MAFSGRICYFLGLINSTRQALKHISKDTTFLFFIPRILWPVDQQSLGWAFFRPDVVDPNFICSV